MRNTDSLSLTLTSDPNNLARLEPFVRDLSLRHGLSSTQSHDILLCLTEAVINGIKHGNAYNPRKKVSIRCQCISDKLKVTVTDEGQGFDFSRLPDPTQERNLMEPGGRGVHIMRNLADNFDYAEDGRTVQMHFKY